MSVLAVLDEMVTFKPGTVLNATFLPSQSAGRGGDLKGIHKSMDDPGVSKSSI